MYTSKSVGCELTNLPSLGSIGYCPQYEVQCTDIIQFFTKQSWTYCGCGVLMMADVLLTVS